MADVKWIKIVVDIFDDEKIKLIEHLPDGDSIIVCWFKLLCLAGKQNNFGVLMLNDRIAYTDEMLATVFRRPLQTIRLALETFEQFGMIEIINGAITIPNWGKHQNADKMQELREYNRLAQQKSRARRKALAAVNDMSITCQPCQDTDIDIDKDIDIENNSTEVAPAAKSDYGKIAEAWNSLNLSRVTKIAAGSERDKLLKRRIKDYGVDGVLNAIENVRNSAFLTGGGQSGWTATFDWFLKPNNFCKVLDGNYNDKKPNKPNSSSGRVENIPAQNPSELWGLVDKI